MMRFISDFHLHSRYSRATSSQMDLENLAYWAKIKGIKILGTGDFTHPEWFKEIKEKLEEKEKGLYKLKENQLKSLPFVSFEKQKDSFYILDINEIRFILTGEISCIYSKKGKTRKIHLIIFAPNIETGAKINTQLSWRFNLKADGRPILGIDAKELIKIILDISDSCFIVPSHAYTPWFSLFGSKSGFDSIEECFEEYSEYIYSIETGLSSSPDMSWRNETLDNTTLISNSDAHSLMKLGREANIFEGEEINYDFIIKAIKRDTPKNPLKLISTVEFFPEEGKYHFDGHRLCKIRLSPKEREKYGGICPHCGKPLTIGVLSRIEKLATRKEGEKPSKALSFLNLVPLVEIIAEAFSQTSFSKTTLEEYQKLINNFGSEFEILINTPIDFLSKISSRVAEGIRKVRSGEIELIPGYDGEYGKVKIFSKNKEKLEVSQKTLF